jgi:hypothetical protein
MFGAGRLDQPCIEGDERDVVARVLTQVKTRGELDGIASPQRVSCEDVESRACDLRQHLDDIQRGHVCSQRGEGSVTIGPREIAFAAAPGESRTNLDLG